MDLLLEWMTSITTNIQYNEGVICDIYEYNRYRYIDNNTMNRH